MSNLARSRANLVPTVMRIAVLAQGELAGALVALRYDQDVIQQAVYGDSPQDECSTHDHGMSAAGPSW